MITQLLIWTGRLASAFMFVAAFMLVSDATNGNLDMASETKALFGISAGIVTSLGLLMLIASQVLAEVYRSNNG